MKKIIGFLKKYFKKKKKQLSFLLCIATVKG